MNIDAPYVVISDTHTYIHMKYIILYYMFDICLTVFYLLIYIFIYVYIYTVHVFDIYYWRDIDISYSHVHILKFRTIFMII